MNQFITKHYKKFLIIGIIFIVLFLASSIAYYIYVKNLVKQPSPTQSAPEEQASKKEDDKKVLFTHKIFDPELVSNIIPLGELNGGYEETQTINGVTVNIKMDASGNAPKINVYAPTDMTLEDYSYFDDKRNTPNYHLGFRISKDVKLGFDHITNVSDEMKEILPPTQTSGYVPPKKKVKFKAGEVIATTSGTDMAHNWNIYLRDNTITNTFVNQERYEKIKEGYDYVNAACPFNYYDDATKQLFINLMGWSKAGQSATCGTNSRDVKGSISGLWHLTKDNTQADYQGSYATPFSIYKASSGDIILYEINRKRSIIGQSNKTYKDPATITAQHCYNLTEYGESKSTQGYAFFKVISDIEMKMAYNATGTCPATFPEASSISYYR